ncbi:MAG: 4Fe-4S binding protein [Treponema sp.]|nr:4Fe-4S binding protein [Treponema sp.]
MTHRYLKNVVSLSFDSEKCTGCGKCVEVCPHGVFNFAEGKARVTERDLCMECGACALNCPAEAITVNAGVGCAAAYIFGWLTGGEPACGCSGGECCG